MSDDIAAFESRLANMLGVLPLEEGGLRQALYPFACLADLLPEACNGSEVVEVKVLARDLMLARTAYLDSE